mmetsp:Transcript_35952/g.81161  ORF Transcript_35952/g.81161 Transcript_35952/m.81161 type:complete len:101 (+) Transcript_35952:435-737(+)
MGAFKQVEAVAKRPSQSCGRAIRSGGWDAHRDARNAGNSCTAPDYESGAASSASAPPSCSSDDGKEKVQKLVIEASDRSQGDTNDAGQKCTRGFRTQGKG